VSCNHHLTSPAAVIFLSTTTTNKANKANIIDEVSRLFVFDGDCDEVLPLHHNRLCPNFLASLSPRRIVKSSLLTQQREC
jgi:hypothetical protein